jgi:hypothetical protein
MTGYVPFQILTAAELNASIDGLGVAVASVATSLSTEAARALAAETVLTTNLASEIARTVIFAPRVSNYAALRAVTAGTIPNAIVYVVGFSTALDGGEGTFCYVASDTTSADNGGTIIVDASARRWHRERSGGRLMLSWFGGTSAAADCAPALRLALAALPSPGGEIGVSSGVLSFGSAVVFNFPSGPFSLTITGEGSDNTVLLWPTNNGVTLNASDFKHSFHIKDITFCAGFGTGGTGLTLNQSQPGGNFSQSDLVRVNFDGLPISNSWSWAVEVFGWCNINYDTVLVYSALAGGISLNGAVATSFQYSIIHNMDRCGFFQCATAVQYGSYAQGLTLNQVNFVNGINGVVVPSGAVGALSQLQMTNCEFTLSGISLYIQAPIFEVQICNNLIIVDDNSNGIVISAGIGYSTFVGNVFVTTHANVNTGGIVVAGAATDCLITGNTFQGLSTAVSLGAATIEWNVQSNHYSNCTTSVSNSGTANTIGGGSP